LAKPFPSDFYEEKLQRGKSMQQLFGKSFVKVNMMACFIEINIISTPLKNKYLLKILKTCYYVK